MAEDEETIDMYAYAGGGSEEEESSQVHSACGRRAYASVVGQDLFPNKVDVDAGDPQNSEDRLGSVKDSRRDIAHVDMIRHPSSAVPRNRVYGKAHLRDIWRNEFGPQTTCLFFPDPDPIKLHDDNPVLVLLVATLVTIWWYHIVFEPRTVLASADLAITQGLDFRA
ncbi:hypothetical protein BKA57DRAFT_441079 [Linnemannia elongata]|nr:hypothetical protein BKA57DRAFT_441079 [Linnemannia elongata]